MPSVSELDTLRTVEEKLAELAAENGKLRTERDEYKKLYLQMLELCRKLERGVLVNRRKILPMEDLPDAISGEFFGYTENGKDSDSVSAAELVEIGKREAQSPDWNKVQPTFELMYHEKYR